MGTNSRTIFTETMAHRQPERLPFDIGGTSLTSMSPQCQENLCEFLGFDKETDMRSRKVDERILKWAGTDFRNVGGIIQLPSCHSVDVSDTEYYDCWGLCRKLIDGQWQIVNSPLRDARTSDLKDYSWPEPRIEEKLLDEWDQQAKRLYNEGEYVIVAEHPFYGILELGMWLCGYDEFMIRMAADPDFVNTFFDIICDIQMKIADQYYSVLGPYIDLTTSGDDFGMQQSPLISPEMFDKLIAPRFSARISFIKGKADCYYWHHTCGSVFKLLDRLIDCGVDILNPVQISAAMMEPKLLKKKYGDRITFWGAVDVQQFLPQANKDEIMHQVTELKDVLGKDGGYVMAPAHNMQSDIPPENIAAWVEAVKYKVKN